MQPMVLVGANDDVFQTAHLNSVYLFPDAPVEGAELHLVGVEPSPVLLDVLPSQVAQEVAQWLGG